MSKESIILVGGGGHCKSCIDVIEQMNRFTIAGIIDLPDKVGQSVLGYPIIATDDDLPAMTKIYQYFLITVGQIKTPATRIRLFAQLIEAAVNLPVIISPFAYVSKHTQIGKGTIVLHQAVINADAHVGQNCIINTKALIEHDARIGDHCHISTGAIVNGGVHIGQGTFYGSGAVTKEYTVIAEKSFIKANSLVKNSYENDHH